MSIRHTRVDEFTKYIDFIWIQLTEKQVWELLLFYDSRSHPLHQDVLAYGCRYGLVYMVNISGKGRIIHKIRAHDEDIQGLDWSSETPEIFKGQAHYMFSRIWIYEFC